MNLITSFSYFFPLKRKFQLKSFSQCGEDRIILHLSLIIGLNKPSYLDIGAYHPFHISNTALLYELGSRGVNVEPNPDAIGLFKKYRSGDTNINAGVSDSEGVMTYFCFNVPTLNTFSKKEAENCLREGYTLECKKKIAVTTLPKIVSEYCHGVMPDILLIDSEGMETKLIPSIKTMKNKPAILCVETTEFSANGSGKKDYKLIRFISHLGYKVYADTYLNSIFIKKNFRK